MVVLVLERVSPSCRGDISRWLVEVKAGVFVGKVNALIRDSLWSRVISQSQRGAVVMIWKTNNEQGFAIRSHQVDNYVPLNIDGIWLSLKPK